MIIGVPKEIKIHENRVAITPANVQTLVKQGHKILIETKAGLGSMITDENYTNSGAVILNETQSIWERAELIVKVKEPQPEEYHFFRPNLILFTYLHLAPEPLLTKALLDKKVIGIAYETVQLNNNLPLLAPMSEVAGRMAVQIGAQILTKYSGGKGILLSGVTGVSAANVVIIGGGIVGTNAAKIAIGMGANVSILDTNIDRLRYLDDIFGTQIQTLTSNATNISMAVKNTDLLISSVLIPGAKAPKLVTEEMVKSMQPKSAIVDVAIDQGGSVETIDTITTHEKPTFIKHEIIHYAVTNMPGAVPITSTFALTNATIPYIQQIAHKGWKKACLENTALAHGLNTIDGHCCYPGVATALNLPYTPYSELL